MVSIKVKFRPSATPSTPGYIYYTLHHGRRQRIISTSLELYPHEWSEKYHSILPPTPGKRMATLLTHKEQISQDTRLLRVITIAQEQEHTTDIDAIIDRYHCIRHEYTLYTYMSRLIHRLRIQERHRTAETYRSAMSSFRAFRQGKDICIDGLTASVIESYQGWLKSRGLIPNTISFYNRILRAVYNKACEESGIPNLRPFSKAYTGIDQTVKRALPLHCLKRLLRLDLKAHQSLAYARDMFMMSFYLRGMSFVDMAYLQKSDLQDGILTYRRRKSGSLLSIRWSPQMQQILERYGTNPTGYLLPIITHHTDRPRSTYRNIGYNINRNLKLLASMAGITHTLTMYVARHSWASVAKAQGIPLSVICDGMGHHSESTTRIYLAQLSTTAVDNANSKILKSLLE